MTNREQIIALAKKRKEENDLIKDKEFFKRVIATLTGVGLLINDNDDIGDVKALWIREIIAAGKIEARVLEVLPAFAHHYRVLIKDNHLPKYLMTFYQGESKVFRGLPAKSCKHWLDTHKPRKVARMRVNLAESPELSLAIRNARASVGLTQKEFSRALDIPFSSLEKVEKGDLNIRGAALRALQYVAFLK